MEFRIKLKYILFFLLCFTLLSAEMTGQSSKVIRNNEIKSQTVYEYFLEDGIDEPVIEKIEEYDENGEVIELKEFSKEGVVKLWMKYKYDEEGRIVEETELDKKGRIVIREVTIYKDELRVEKHFFDGKGRMVKKKRYEYEY